MLEILILIIVVIPATVGIAHAVFGDKETIEKIQQIKAKKDAEPTLVDNALEGIRKIDKDVRDRMK